MARGSGGEDNEPASLRPPMPEASRAQVILRPRQLLGALAEHGVEFVVIGGLALPVHDVRRASDDLDIVPDPDPANLARLAAALQKLDARVDIGDLQPEELGIEPDAEHLAEGANWGLVTTYGLLDVMQDVPGLRDYAQLRANAIEVGGVLYAGKDELIAMKSSVRRPQDLIDIAELEARDGTS